MNAVGHSRELGLLLNLLQEVNASQFILLVEESLVPLLSALTTYSTLTQHGVTALVPLNSSTHNLEHDSGALVFITKASPDSLVLVAKSASRNVGKNMTCIVVPEISPSVELIFTKFAVLGDIDIVQWPLIFVRDSTQPKILSLFDEDSVFDPSLSVWPLVYALDSLQVHLSGAFGRTTAIGPRAVGVAKLLKEKRKEHAARLQQSKTASDRGTKDHYDYNFGYASQTFSGDEIDHLIVIDRSLDVATPLLIQATYQGVLAETIGISASGSTNTLIASGGDSMNKNEKHKVSLRDDAMMGSIAELGFADACKRIYEAAKDLQQEYQNDAITKPDSTLSEIKSAVSKLGSLQSTQRVVDTHAELAAVAMAKLESPISRDAFDLQTSILKNQIANGDAVVKIQDLIFRGCSLKMVLRLICLLCIIRGGLKESILHSVLYGDILRTYGYEHLATLHYLECRGLLFTPRASSILSSLGISAFTSETDSKKRTKDVESGNFAQSGTLKTESGSSLDSDNQDSLNPLKGLNLSEPLSQTYSWYSLNKTYKMFPNDTETVPESVAYAGHVPLLARISQMAVGKIPFAKTPLEQEFFEDFSVSKDDDASRESKLRRTLLKNSPESLPPITLVVVVGGITYAEATAIEAAITHGSQKDMRVLIASNCTITGDVLVSGM